MIEWIWGIFIVFVALNYIISAAFDLSRKPGQRVGPKWSAVYFPLYKEKCKQNYYKKF